MANKLRRIFSATDVRAQNKVCIIGQTIVKNLFANEDPVGQQLRLRNVPFKVIGVLKERGQSPFGQDQDDVIIAPYSTVYYRLSGEPHINQILARAASLDQMTQAQAEITTIMREAHKIQEGEDDDFTVRNQTDIASTAQETTKVLTILLGSIASISLAGRRHRHHEHHAGLGHRAHPRDRHPHGHRRPPPRHPGPVPHRGHRCSAFPAA